ncbi:MAG TPA: hypothetical protein VJQ54_23570, partial [Candidatus Sulfotelmatobacter sp.]|nr:hypothetical protein [Candidatus Sulfotelmatobacter sp.]
MEFFHNVNIDFLGKKWYFIAFSLISSVAGVLSILFWHHIPWGVDFRGGTLVYVRFSHKPDVNAIRADLDRAGLKDPKIQPYDVPSLNEVLIDLDVRETSEKALDEGKTKIIQALEKNAPAGKTDLNNASFLAVKNNLMDKDPMHLGTDADQKYSAQAGSILGFRDKVLSGVFSSFDQLKGAPGVDPAVAASIPENFYLSDFSVRDVAIVGPQV